MTNREQFSRAVSRLERERALLLEGIGRMSRPQLDFKPSRPAWSVGEVVHHVALAEKLWQGYVRELLDKGDPQRGARREISLQEIPFSSAAIPDALLRSPLVLGPLSFMVNFVPGPVQSTLFAVPLIKMQAGPRMQPTHGLPSSTLLELAGQVRQTTLKLLAPAAQWDLTRFRIVHPLVGDRDIYGILELIASHDQRHRLQIKSIQENPDFPH